MKSFQPSPLWEGRDSGVMRGHLLSGSVLWTVWHEGGKKGEREGGRSWVNEQGWCGGTGPGSISAGGKLINHEGAT